jgi:hypothetical protein
MIGTLKFKFFNRPRRIATSVAICVALIGILSACAERNLYAQLDQKGYIQDQKEIVEAADWSAAETFEIDIRQNEFRPTIIHLLQGEPYIMLIENRDDVAHFLAAQDFFKTIAIRKILTETEEIKGVNLIGIILNPGEVKELHFIPVRDGWYDFEGGQGFGIFGTDIYYSPLSTGVIKGMIGSFVVEE